MLADAAGDDPVTLLALSDERDWWERRLHAAECAAFDRGVAYGYDRGYDDGIADRKREQQYMLEALQVHGRRWEVRGEPRSRETFGQPDPGDYPGRGPA
jgi:hypothetical protein